MGGGSRSCATRAFGASCSCSRHWAEALSPDETRPPACLPSPPVPTPSCVLLCLRFPGMRRTCSSQHRVIVIALLMWWSLAEGQLLVVFVEGGGAVGQGEGQSLVVGPPTTTGVAAAAPRTASSAARHRRRPLATTAPTSKFRSAPLCRPSRRPGHRRWGNGAVCGRSGTVACPLFGALWRRRPRDGGSIISGGDGPVVAGAGHDGRGIVALPSGPPRHAQRLVCGGRPARRRRRRRRRRRGGRGGRLRAAAAAAVRPPPTPSAEVAGEGGARHLWRRHATSVLQPLRVGVGPLRVGRGAVVRGAAG
ncbi:hypothetical protein I4F81_003369 [Pyropia yezoensis]|uniref:Uncharacterized protein n=1 Tax=Pyropia yezoensis TaxID=2788 RepID=A0ACC3BSE6_PYRYE|nr:hypothetical protein I4F81_003369 [Neopyropia yezoensis]